MPNREVVGHFISKAQAVSCTSAKPVVQTLLSLGLLLSSACAVTQPLLIEPRIPNQGDVRVQTGAAAQVLIGDAPAKIQKVNHTISSPKDLNEGLLLNLMAQPGVAPVLRGSMRVDSRMEASVRWNGRSFGLSGRYLAWEERTENASSASFSVGLDTRAVLFPSNELGTQDLRFEQNKGFGASLPIALAWQSDAGLLMAYLGMTFSYDRLSSTVVQKAGAATQSPVLQVAANQFALASHVGIGVGFRAFHVLLELAVQRHWLSATLNQDTSAVALWTLGPAFALSMNF